MKKEDALKRIREIKKEAKAAQSDAVLHGLRAERDALVAEFGEECKECRTKHLVLKYGYCFTCAMDMGIA